MKRFLLAFLIISTAFAVSVHIADYNGTALNLTYDYFNNSGDAWTSWSYKDSSARNPNAYLMICNGTNMTNVYLDLRYASESGNLSTSVLTLQPYVNVTFLNESCLLFDVDTSVFRALYPAQPFFYIYNYTNETNETVEHVILSGKLNETFEGEYKLGMSFDQSNGIIYVNVYEIDTNDTQIVTQFPYLFLSIVRDGQSLREKQAEPFTPVPFNYSFVGEEGIYVNGLLSLRIKTFDPCGTINESGYYVLNDSSWNYNDTCVVIENVTNLLVNFANYTVDGDANSTGAYRDDVCGVLIRNAKNVTLLDARVQNFRRGICIENSEGVEISGTHSSYNYDSIFVRNSTAAIHNIRLSSDDEELTAMNNSRVSLDRISLISPTEISADVKDVALKDVPHPPPDRSGYVNVEQFAEFIRNEADAWLYRLSFHYTYPLPNNVTHIVYITKVDGNYVNGTWHNLTYTDYTANKQDYTDSSGRLTGGVAWVEMNFTNFSVFIPYGLNMTAPVPVPVPQPVPEPVPTPSEVVGQEEKAVPPKLNLTLITKNITLQQGEVGTVMFKLKNYGQIDVYRAVVQAFALRGWNVPPTKFDVVHTGQEIIDKIYITPYENEVPGTYYIPVKAMMESTGVTLDAEILKVVVLPRQRVAKVDILEILPYLTLPENTKYELSVLMENSGDYDLHNITLKLEKVGDCVSRVEGSYNLSKGEKKTLTFTLYTKKAGAKCKGLYVFNSDRGIVGVYPVIIKVMPLTPLKSIRIFLVIYVMWTAGTVWMLRKKRRRERLE